MGIYEDIKALCNVCEDSKESERILDWLTSPSCPLIPYDEEEMED